MVCVVVLVVVFSLCFVLIKGECDLYFKNLTDAAVNTYACFGKFGKPLAICGQCISNITVLEATLNDTEPKNKFGVPCKYFIEGEPLAQVNDLIYCVVALYFAIYIVISLISPGEGVDFAKSS